MFLQWKVLFSVPKMPHMLCFYPSNSSKIRISTATFGLHLPILCNCIFLTLGYRHPSLKAPDFSGCIDTSRLTVDGKTQTKNKSSRKTQLLQDFTWIICPYRSFLPCWRFCSCSLSSVSALAASWNENVWKVFLHLLQIFHDKVIKVKSKSYIHQNLCRIDGCTVKRKLTTWTDP